MNDKPKVSVLMLTFNHGKYISQAIESVISQETNFEFELIIGDDCSEDNTQEIIVEYAKKHPKIIRAVLRKRNVGTSKNLVSIFRKCRGDYIAFLEGDDFWTDNYKLQKQVDFLDTHHDYSAAMCDVMVVDRYGKITLNGPKVLDHEMETPLDFVKTMYPDNQFKFIGSLMSRNIWNTGDYEKYLLQTQIVTDLIMLGILICRGKIYFDESTMAAYRWVPSHGSNYSSIKSDLKNYDRIQSFRMDIMILPTYTHPWVYMRIERDYWLLLYQYLYEKRYKAIMDMFLKHMNIVEKLFFVPYWIRRKITKVG